jgi:phosphatidylserine decarboxylase
MTKHITNKISNIFHKIATTRFPKVIQNSMNTLYVKILGLDMSEFKTPNSYETLNQLFTRALIKKRDFDISKNSIISPTDSYISQCGQLENETLMQIKGMEYNVKELLTIHSGYADKMINGSYINFYLSPKDYHRYHAPYFFNLKKLIHVPGKLYPVNFTYLKKQLNLFIENERVILECEYEGKYFYLIFVGALNVGKMVFNFESKVNTNSNTNEIKVYEYEDMTFKKGDELGYFEMGSTVVMITEENFMSIDVQTDIKVKFAQTISTRL